MSDPYYYNYQKCPPDKILDSNGCLLVGPVIVITERDSSNKCACIRLSDYLSIDLLNTYGLAKTSKAFHPYLQIFKKKKDTREVYELPMNNVFIEYIPECLYESVFSDFLTSGVLQVYKKEPTFNGSPVIASKPNDMLISYLKVTKNMPESIVALPPLASAWREFAYKR